jgi:hypothetical protein
VRIGCQHTHTLGVEVLAEAVGQDDGGALNADEDQRQDQVGDLDREGEDAEENEQDEAQEAQADDDRHAQNVLRTRYT